MQLKEILKGFRLGTPQSVGNMKVIPVLTNTPFVKVSGMENVYLKKDIAYETLLMATQTQVIAVIPQGLMYMTAESAQDRIIPSAHLIKGEKQVNADCVQASEGGHFDSEVKEREYGMLPRELRIVALEKRDDSEYDSIWSNIEKFMRDVGMNGKELVRFFREYKEELETFVAQFEPVDKQVGAIFVINNVLLGIEIMPNYEIWQQMWRPLVRDCYGSEAISYQKKGEFGSPVKALLKPGEIKSFGDLEKEVERVGEEEKRLVGGLLAEVVETDFDQKTEEELEDFTLYTFDSDKLVGQGVQHGPERFVYLSLMTQGKIPRKTRARKFDARWNKSPYTEDSDFSIDTSFGIE